MNQQRRSFIKQSGLALTALSFAPGVSFSNESQNTSGNEEILKKLSKLNDAQIEDLLERQIYAPDNHWDGGVFDGYEIPNAHATYGFIVRLGNAYACSYSRFYLDVSLEIPLEKAARCLLNIQHEDGTIDLHSTNFHSTPDTAFLVNYLSPIYVVLRRMKRNGLSDFLNYLGDFIQKTGKCLAVGGIHTANHRWVVCSALSWVNKLYPAQKYLDRIDEWLGEGIDMDPDGQFAERSVSVYSPVCDNMFLTMARLLNRDELLDVVRKNLNMTLYYIQPGGEVLTDASYRQDSAQTGYVDRYYYAYRYFAIKDKNPVFAAVCQLIENEMPDRITRYISELLEDPIFEKDIIAASKIPDDYFKRFSYSGVFRIRRENADLSVIEQNPTFMSFMKGQAVLQSVRLAAAFFGSRGQFISQNAELIGDTIVLTKSETHGYYQPYPEEKRSGDGDWDKMPRTQRQMSELQTMNYRVEISEKNGKVALDIEIKGTPYVPVSMEMSFRPGGALSGVISDKNLADVYFLESGTGQYTYGNNTIKFGPGIAEHKWAEIRGMLPKQIGQSVYLTGYTPFKHVIELS